MDLFQVVDNGEQLPLHINPVFATQGKPVKLHCRPDMGKRRLADGKTKEVYGPAGRRIYLPLHSLGKTIFFDLSVP